VSDEELITHDDLDEYLDDREQEAVNSYMEEQALIAEAIEAGTPVWQLVPIERIENLPPDQLRKAMSDPDRMPLSEYEKDEAEIPLLKEIRLSHGSWIEDEVRRRRSEARAKFGDTTE